MKIAVTISYTSSWSELADIVIPNMAAYCNKHSYSLFVTVDEYERYNGLYKIRNIETLFKYGFDIVFCFDCDTLITNHTIKLEQFTTNEEYIFVCEGMNMGVFGVRKSYMGQYILRDIKEQIVLGNIDCEQTYVNNMSESQNRYAFKKFSHPAFNSYLSQCYPEIQQPVTEEQGQWIEGKSFVLHLPALPLEKRIEIMRNTKITK